MMDFVLKYWKYKNNLEYAIHNITQYLDGNYEVEIDWVDFYLDYKEDIERLFDALGINKNITIEHKAENAFSYLTGQIYINYLGM